MAAPEFNGPIKPKTRSSRAQGGGELPRLGLHPEVPGTCTKPQCGEVADTVDETGLQDGWVRVGVYGSTDPDRLWCSGLCATYGVALAELRIGTAAASV